MASAKVKDIREQIQGDDSIIIDTSAIMAEGADIFFSQLVEALPSLKDTYLIIPQEAIEKVNVRLESKSSRTAAIAAKAAEWLQKAVELTEGKDYRVIIVGAAEGAFEDKTILNQVSFLMPNHNIMLITQDRRMTQRARALRDPAIQGDSKLHCCYIRPEGRLSLYQFPTDNTR